MSGERERHSHRRRSRGAQEAGLEVEGVEGFVGDDVCKESQSQSPFCPPFPFPFSSPPSPLSPCHLAVVLSIAWS